MNSTSGRAAVVKRGRFHIWVPLLAVLALLLSACPADEPSVAEPEPEEPEAQEPEAQEPEGEEPEGEEPSLRVAFVYESETDIPGFEGSLKMGEEYLREQLPFVEVTAVEDIDEGPGSERTFARLADEGYDLIFALSFGYGDQVLEVAERYPDVKFEHVFGFREAENVSTFTGARYEGYYLAGIVAAEATPSGRLGYVGGFPIPLLVSDINALALGARSVNPDATVQVVWSLDWEDPVRDRQAASALVDAGVELLAQATGSPSVGAVATAADLPWIQHSDVRAGMAFGPETFLGAPYFEWGLYFVARANDVINGTWESQSYFGRMSDGFVSIALTENVPADLVDRVEAKKQEIADGSLVVFEGPIAGQDGTELVPEGEAASFDVIASTLVEGVIGEIP